MIGLDKVDLQDALVRLRPYRLEDADAVFEAVAESIPEVGAYETWCHEGYTLENAAEYVAWWVSSWEKGTAYYFAVHEAGGRYLGSCGLAGIDREHGTAGMGFWIRTPRTNQGFATAAARLVTEFGNDVLGLARVEVLAAVDNAASRRVAEKLGARFEGILRDRFLLRGKRHDGALYALTE